MYAHRGPLIGAPKHFSKPCEGLADVAFARRGKITHTGSNMVLNHVLRNHLLSCRVRLGSFTSQDFDIILCSFVRIRRLRKSPQYLLVSVQGNVTVSTHLSNSSNSFHKCCADKYQNLAREIPYIRSIPRWVPHPANEPGDRAQRVADRGPCAEQKHTLSLSLALSLSLSLSLPLSAYVCICVYICRERERER